MRKSQWVMVTDRGGHLHNALMLVDQLGLKPDAYVTTHGPDIEALKSQSRKTLVLPYLFSWLGKKRFFNPISLLWHIGVSFSLAARLRPRAVVSLGASNVVFFCYCARLFGARVYHVECMNQVETASITGRLLYPVCEKLYVQWEELLSQYGAKAAYAGWVL